MTDDAAGPTAPESRRRGAGGSPGASDTRSTPLFHLALLLLTFCYDHVRRRALLQRRDVALGAGLLRGLRFSIPALLILGVHEMGHYLMCRRYGLAATLPYFIPAPDHVRHARRGDPHQGADPAQGDAPRRRRGRTARGVRDDSPVPLLRRHARRRRSRRRPTPETQVFGYPLAVRFAQDWTGIGRYTSATVHEDPTFMAAWLGLLVTALNLLPIGQLDGGHVLRVRAREEAAARSRSPSWSLALAAALRGGYTLGDLRRDRGGPLRGRAPARRGRRRAGRNGTADDRSRLPRGVPALLHARPARSARESCRRIPGRSRSPRPPGPPPRTSPGRR